jgi:hypothetical protein
MGHARASADRSGHISTLIRAFIDPDAEIVYVTRDDVLQYAEREVRSASMRRARSTRTVTACAHSRSSSRSTISARIPLVLMARVVHGADVAEDLDATAQSAGLLAIADGFALLEIDDQRQLALEVPVYDALYAWARHEVANG